MEKQITIFTMEKLHDLLEKKRLTKPFVLRCTRTTAEKIADVYGVTWIPIEKGKQLVGPFLIIA